MTYTISYRQSIRFIVALLIAYTVISLATFTPATSIGNYRILNTVSNPYDTIVAPDRPPVH
jgi:hypothetical protein